MKKYLHSVTLCILYPSFTRFSKAHYRLFVPRGMTRSVCVVQHCTTLKCIVAPSDTAIFQGENSSLITAQPNLGHQIWPPGTVVVIAATAVRSRNLPIPAGPCRKKRRQARQIHLGAFRKENLKPSR